MFLKQRLELSGFLPIRGHHTFPIETDRADEGDVRRNLIHFAS